jgi:CubicO group peptidase (beta-lactamase class C family)
MKTKLVYGLITAVMLFGCKEEELTLQEKFDQQVISTIKEKNIPSFSTCLLLGDSIYWQGYYATHEDWEVSSNTIYNVASVSKLVTATAVMQLVEQGEISLDQGINQYLDFEVNSPYFPEDSITVRMLLTHRSGLSWPRAEDAPGYYDPYSNDRAPSLGPWLKSFLQTEEAWNQSRPGSADGYSNHGAALLGYLVESVTGIDFRDYCQAHIFDPLEMTHTQFSHLYFNSSDDFALPFSLGYKYSVPYYPASTLKTTISDFSKFMLAYMNQGAYREVQILSATSVAEMLRIQNFGSSYGLIWLKQGRGFGHAGAFYDATSFVDFSPAVKAGFIGFINKTQWEISEPDIVYPSGTLYQLVSDHFSELRKRE